MSKTYTREQVRNIKINYYAEMIKRDDIIDDLRQDISELQDSVAKLKKENELLRKQYSKAETNLNRF